MEFHQYIGDYTTSYIEIVVSHEIRIPFLTNQDSMVHVMSGSKVHAAQFPSKMAFPTSSQDRQSFLRASGSYLDVPLEVRING